MNYQWRWGILLEAQYVQALASGLGWTLLITACAWLLAFPLGLAAGSFRAGRAPGLRALGTAYTEFFRGIPLLVQLFLWFFVVPELLPGQASAWIKRELPQPEFWTAVLALGFYTSARLAEQVRTGLASISPGLREAAAASGLSGLQALRLLLLPLALRVSLPSLTSEFLALLKNSSVALTIGLLELTGQARRIENASFQAFEAFAAATAIYLACSIATVSIARRMERRLAVPGQIATLQSRGGRA
jgi:glutamate/aspartate transport system permease protein